MPASLRNAGMLLFFNFAVSSREVVGTSLDNALGRPHGIYWPPFTSMFWPVTKLPSDSEAR